MRVGVSEPVNASHRGGDGRLGMSKETIQQGKDNFTMILHLVVV